MSTAYIDVKYINLCSSVLERFKQKQNNLWNFRCPICGDSKKHKNKCRGFIYEKRNKYFYRCHNCNVGTSFNKFLEQISPALHRDYITEIIKKKLGGKKMLKQYYLSLILFLSSIMSWKVWSLSHDLHRVIQHTNTYSRD